MENCAALPDEELHRTLKELVRNERRHLGKILSRLGEMDRRRLAQKMGYHSLFEYCLKELRYSESETAIRIHAARAAAKYPLIYPFLRSGRLSLTAISKLAPHLTPENYRGLLSKALGATKRQLEALVAELNPEPEPRESIRVIAVGPTAAAPAAPGAEWFGLPEDGAGSAVSPAGAASVFAPPETSAPAGKPLAYYRRVEFTFTADEELLSQVTRARELLRHKHPKGRLEEIFSEALHALLPRLDPGRRLAGARKTAGRAAAREAGRAAAVRKIPNWVKKEVWGRDFGRCVFVGPGGVRCGSADAPEFDHIRPFARGGRSDDPGNVRILCRAHNDAEARRIFGDDRMERAVGGEWRRPAGGAWRRPAGAS